TQVLLIDDVDALNADDYAALMRVLDGNTSVAIVSRATSGPASQAFDLSRSKKNRHTNVIHADMATIIMGRLDGQGIRRRAKIRVDVDIPEELCNALAEITGGILTFVDGLLNRLGGFQDADLDQISLATLRSWVGQSIEAGLSQISNADVCLLTY